MKRSTWLRPLTVAIIAATFLFNTADVQAQAMTQQDQTTIITLAIAGGVGLLVASFFIIKNKIEGTKDDLRDSYNDGIEDFNSKKYEDAILHFREYIKIYETESSPSERNKQPFVQMYSDSKEKMNLADSLKAALMKDKISSICENSQYYKSIQKYRIAAQTSAQKGYYSISAKYYSDYLVQYRQNYEYITNEVASAIYEQIQQETYSQSYSVWGGYDSDYANRFAEKQESVKAGIRLWLTNDTIGMADSIQLWNGKVIELRKATYGPFNGYKYLKWGMSSSFVKNVYQGDLSSCAGKNSRSSSYYDNEDLIAKDEPDTCLVESNPSAQISKRTFYFHNDSLYKVVISFTTDAWSNYSAILSDFQSDFGQGKTVSDRQNISSPELPGATILYQSKTTTWTDNRASIELSKSNGELSQKAKDEFCELIKSMPEYNMYLLNATLEYGYGAGNFMNKMVCRALAQGMEQGSIVATFTNRIIEKKVSKKSSY